MRCNTSNLKQYDFDTKKWFEQSSYCDITNILATVTVQKGSRLKRIWEDLWGISEKRQAIKKFKSKFEEEIKLVKANFEKEKAECLTKECEKIADNTRDKKIESIETKEKHLIERIRIHYEE